MINQENIVCIEKLLNNKKIIYSKILSNSFNINCFKFKTSDNLNYVVKFYEDKDFGFNAIVSETKNLIYLNNLNFNFFPKVCAFDKNYLIMSFISNNSIYPNKINHGLLNSITSIHLIKNKYYGFDFDTQIGGLKQINTRSSNWVEFYRDYRIGYIFELINNHNPMDESINKKIEILLKKLGDYIPKNPKPSLLHGDLWEGNILYNDCEFVSFIDPGSFYGHNELEIAYLRWFNPSFIGRNFLEKYNNIINIDKDYLKYEPIYQLYYSLLNVHLWDREYIKDVDRLLNNIKL